MAGNTTKKQNNKINFGKISKTKITLLILIAFFFVATIVTNSQQSSGMPMGMPPGAAGNKKPKKSKEKKHVASYLAEEATHETPLKNKHTNTK